MAGKPDIKSALHRVVEQVDVIKDFDGKKSKAVEMITESGINDADKRKMLMIINYQCPNSYKLTQYLYNSILKFEGLGSLARTA